MFICSFWNCNPPVTAFPLHTEGKRAQPTRGTSKNSICASLPVFLFNFSSVIKGVSYHSTHHKTAVEYSLSPYSLTLWRLHFRYAQCWYHLSNTNVVDWMQKEGLKLCKQAGPSPCLSWGLTSPVAMHWAWRLLTNAVKTIWCIVCQSPNPYRAVLIALCFHLPVQIISSPL